MGRIAAIGEPGRVDGLALAGVLVLPAEGAEQVRAQWAALPPDVVAVILTRAAVDALPASHRTGPLTVVMHP